jgi:hypothetical protein
MDIIFMFFWRKKHEKNLSTEYQKKEEEPRLPQENEHEVRKGYPQKEEAEGQKEVERLKAQWKPLRKAVISAG